MKKKRKSNVLDSLAYSGRFSGTQSKKNKTVRLVTGREKAQFLPHDPTIKVEAVNHPAHYNNGKIECIEYLEDQFMSRPHEWSAVKYITRANSKGAEVQDLEKAIWYLRRKIALLSGSAPRPNQMPKQA